MIVLVLQLENHSKHQKYQLCAMGKGFYVKTLQKLCRLRAESMDLAVMHCSQLVDSKIVLDFSNLIYLFRAVLDSACQFEIEKILGMPLFSTCIDFDRLLLFCTPDILVYQKHSFLLFHPQFCLPCGLVEQSFIRFISNGARCLDS